MQANYLRYLASIYPEMSPVRSSSASLNDFSVSPIRSRKYNHAHDDIPVKKVTKPFEQILEEQLQQNPSFELSKNNSISMNTGNNSHNLFLKRGEGNLCTVTRSFSNSKLRTLRNRFLNYQNNSNSIDIEKVSILKKELEVKNEILRSQEKNLTKTKISEQVELNRNRQEKLREKRTSPSKNEVENLRKIIQKLTEDDKIKALKHHEEVKKLNAELTKLRKQIIELERKNNRIISYKQITPVLATKSMRVSPEKPKESSQGKIKKYIEKKNLLGTKTVIRPQENIFDGKDRFFLSSNESL
ncbi:hypothetical protein SteCoe_35791 [Stentor coeruleus]|uniref:CENPJ tubulin-binding region domain-containing protein n=1 Tax=Stentor coeruleus TaxID=5963 RepID=A0A1R2ARQ4_9CILI|nr:hypothetical protein SteCoe_35791 [Stentor coeruleus]